MEKHWAMITWHGTHDMANQTFTHVTWSAGGSEAAKAAAEKWGRQNLAPTTDAKVDYLGFEERTV